MLPDKINGTVAKIEQFVGLVSPYAGPTQDLCATLVDWLEKGGNINQLLDVLSLLFTMLPPIDAMKELDVEEWLLQTVTRWLTGNGETKPEDNTVLQGIEMTVKTAIMALCQSLLDCTINPSISNYMMDAVEEGQPYYDYFGSPGNGIVLPLNYLDIFSLLQTPPTGTHGKYCYFDVTDDTPEKWIKVKKGDFDERHFTPESGKMLEDKKAYYIMVSEIELAEDKDNEAKVKEGVSAALYIKKEINNEYLVGTLVEGTTITKANIRTILTGKVPIPASETCNSRDFDAFLWYVVNRGGDSNLNCVWDNRYKPFRGQQFDHNSTDFHTPKSQADVAAYNRSGDLPEMTITIELTNDREQIKAQQTSGVMWSKKSPKDNILDLKDIENITNTRKKSKKSECFAPQYITREAGCSQVTNRIREKLSDVPIGTVVTIVYNFIDYGDDSGVNIPSRKVKYVVNGKVDGHIDTTGIEDGVSLLKIERLKIDGLKKTVKKGTQTDAEFKKKLQKVQYARFKYEESNTFGTGNIRMWITPTNYFRDLGGGVKFSAPVKKTLLEWDWDFINSIQFYDPKVLVSKIIDSLCNATSQVSLSFNNDIIEGLVTQIIKKTIEQDDMQVSDCYFNFSNKEFDALLKKADEQRRNLLIQGTNLNLDNIKNEIENEKSDVSLAGSVKTLKRMSAEVDATGATDPTASINMGLTWQLLLTRICMAFVTPILSPKCLTVIGVNLIASGKGIPQGIMDAVEILTSVIVQVVVAIKDEIVDMLASLIIEMLEKLMVQVSGLIIQEQLETYERMIEQLYRYFKKWYKLFGSTSKGNIDNVNYADIDNAVTTDATESNKC